MNEFDNEALHGVITTNTLNDAKISNVWWKVRDDVELVQCPFNILNQNVTVMLQQQHYLVEYHCVNSVEVHMFSLNWFVYLYIF